MHFKWDLAPHVRLPRTLNPQTRIESLSGGAPLFIPEDTPSTESTRPSSTSFRLLPEFQRDACISNQI